MTNSPNPNPENTSRPRRRLRRILIWGGVGLGVSTIAIGTAATWFVRNRLAPLVGDIVGGIVQRPVIVGPVERVTPISIRFGASAIPATANNPNNATTEAVEVGFSLFSLLTNPTIKFDIMLVNADVYLEEDATGDWIRTELLLEGELPIEIEFGTVGVRNANLQLQPYSTNIIPPEAIGLNVDQAVANLSEENQRIRGRANGEFAEGGTFNVQAHVFLPDDKIDGRLRANNLQTSQFAGFIKTPEVVLQTGIVNADIRLELENSQLSLIQGQANLNNVRVDLPTLQQPVQPINGQFRFARNQIQIERLTTGLGETGVNVTGTALVNPQLDFLTTQLDIAANIEPIAIATLLDIAEIIAEEPINLPVALSGEVQTDINVTGIILQPIVDLAIQTTAPTLIDRITLDDFSTNLQITALLDEDLSLTTDPDVKIESLQIQPSTGGIITGVGEVKLTGLKQLIDETQQQNQVQTPPPTPPQTPPVLLPVPQTPTVTTSPFNPEVQLSLDVNNVGLDSLAQSYGFSTPFRWGSVFAEAEVSGTLENLRGQADFSLPTATTPISGQANLTQTQLNSTIKIAEGNVNITAQQTQQQRWNANINANQVALDPLVNAGLLFVDLEPGLKSDIARINLSDGRLNLQAELLGDLENLDLARINGESTIAINLGGTLINATAQLRQGEFVTAFETEPLSLNRVIEAGIILADLPANTLTQIQNLEIQNGTLQAEGRVRGNINNLDEITARGEGLVNLGRLGGTINASGRLSGDLFQANIDTSALPLNPLIDIGLPLANLPPDVNTSIQRLDFRNGTLEATALLSGNINELTQVTATANSQINLGNVGGTVAARGQLTDGQLQASINTNQVGLDPLINAGLPLANLSPNLNREIQDINFRNGELELQASISGNLNNIIQLENPLPTLTANLDGLVNLGQAGGQVTVSGQAVAGRWQTIINADQIALNRFSSLVESQTQDILRPLQQQGLITQAEAMPLLRGLLNSRLSASGSLIELNPELVRAMGRLQLTELPIIRQPLDAAFNWDGQRLGIERAESEQFGADGFVAVEFSGEGVPEISNLNLNVRLSDFNLQSPLVQRILPDLPPEVTQDSPLLAGVVNFDGQLTGSLSTLQLAGNLRLEDLIVRELRFDPVLAGTVNAGLNQGVNLALAGQQDRIELVLNNQYLPESFLIQQDETIAQGTPVGENLLVTLEQFPLSTLSLAPLADQGIGELSGIASSEILISQLATLDPFQIGAQGTIAVDDLALGYIDLDRFQANINLANGQFQLADGALGLGQTQIDINAQANLVAIIADLQTGIPPFSAEFDPETPPDFAAQINIPNGSIQDVLTALRFYNLTDLARGLQPPEYGTAADVIPVPVGLPPDATLAQQLRRLAEIQAIFQQQFQQQQQQEPLPPLQDLRGNFAGEIGVQGSIASGVTGNINFENQGDWTWGRYSIDRLLVNASLDPDNVLRVQPVQINSGETLYDFRGQLALDTQQPSGQFRVKNIRLEQLQAELENFVELPNIDVNGQLNFQATIAGSFANPQASGEFTVVDGIFNTEPIKEARGSFNYNNARLFLASTILLTEQDPIRIRGQVPYRLPFAEVSPESNELRVSMEIQNEGLNVINLLNPEISWVEGTGLVQLNITGFLEQDPNGEIAQIFLQPEGLLNIQDGVVSTESLQQSIVGLSGSATFDRDRIIVNGIQGELVGEAGTGNIVIAGTLPLLVPFPDEAAETPLRIQLENLKVDVPELYMGDAAGIIQIDGTLLRPEIGGGIILSEGTVILPVAAAAPDTGTGVLLDTGPIRVSLDNFRLTLAENIQIESPPVSEFLNVPIVDFSAQGTLVVSGELETLEDIRPSGTIELTGGALNLYTSRFILDRGYPQQAIFVPSRGLDPILDLRLVTRIAETTRFQEPPSAFSSEISEVPTASSLGTVRTIRVTALVRGPASQVNDIVQLQSSPSRSQTQLIALLGGSAIEGITGDSALVIANIASAGLFNQIQQNILDATGLTEFRLYPARISKSGGSREASALGLGLEVGLDVTDQVSVSLSRVLADDQPTQLGVNYRVNDNLLLRGATGFSSENEIRFEYEIQF